jgi:hypothetical protein
VEIVEQEMLGALPVDEEQVPEQNVQVNPLLFDFFGMSAPPPPHTTAKQSQFGSECLW